MSLGASFMAFCRRSYGISSGPGVLFVGWVFRKLVSSFREKFRLVCSFVSDPMNSGENWGSFTRSLMCSLRLIHGRCPFRGFCCVRFCM